MRFSLRKTKNQLSGGFTLVEILIIAPVVIIVISGFVALMITIVGDVLTTRDQSNMSFEVQDALDRIEQDTRLTTQFLATSGTQVAPQGSDSNFTGTAAFDSTSSLLVMGGLTTDKNPIDSTRKLVFYAKQPNDCGTEEVYNRVFQAKIIYFIKSGSLWRRAVLPDYNTNAVPNSETVCAAPWQRNSCSPGYGVGTRCQTNDAEVMKNVKTFNVKYLSNASSDTDLTAAQALSANAIEVTLEGEKTTAGRVITTSGSIRGAKLNNIDVDLPPPSTPIISSQLSGNSATFSWSPVPVADSYAISYNINGGAWQDATTDAQTTSYTVNTNRTNTITFRVSAKNGTGNSPYATATATIPDWYACDLQNNWDNIGSGFSTAAYTKTSDDVVMLKGVIDGGTTTAGTVLCKLPVGYRPTHRLIFQAASNNTGARVDILTNGDVVIVSGSSLWLTLDNINFVASGAAYTWTDFPTPLSNSWLNYGDVYSPLRYTKDPTNRVHLQGLVKSGNNTSGLAIAALPATHRPPQYTHFVASSNSVFNYMGISGASGSIQTKGIPNSAHYSLQAMFYASTFAGWTNLAPLYSGWVWYEQAHSSPQYTKSADGIVTIKGFIKSGSTGSETLLAQLPTGYMPKERLVIPCVAGGQYCRFDIKANGDIALMNSNATWTSIEVSFIAEQ